MRFIVALVAGVILTVPLIGSGLNAQDKEGVVKVDARTLLSDYAKDRKAADLKYKGKVLQVEGVVRNDTSKAVNLEGGTEFKVLVQCAFGTAGIKAIREHNSAVRLKEAEAQRKKQKVDLPKRIVKGNTVVIKGTCNGLSGMPTRYVVLDNCEVIDPILVKR